MAELMNRRVTLASLGASALAGALKLPGGKIVQAEHEATTSRHTIWRILLFHNIPNIDKFTALHNRGYHFVGIEPFISFFRGIPTALPSLAASIMFDDGWTDHYEKGLKLMDRLTTKLGYDVTFIWAIMPKFIDRGWDHRLYLDGSNRHATLRTVISARRSGIYLANHTIDHANLVALSEDDRNAQIVDGFNNIDAICDMASVSQFGKVLVYPLGLFNSGVTSFLNYEGVDLAMTSSKVSNGSLDEQSYDRRLEINRKWQS